MVDQENEQIRINEMEKEVKRKFDREMKKKRQIEEDLKPEVMLREQMEITRKKVKGSDPIFERLRAYICVEGDEK